MAKRLPVHPREEWEEKKQPTLKRPSVHPREARVDTNQPASRRAPVHPREAWVDTNQPASRRIPVHPRLARVKKNQPASPRNAKPQPREVCVAQSLQADPHSSPLAADNVEEDNLSIIQAFLEKRPKEKDQKLKFLASICMSCSKDTAERDMLCFSKLELVDAIKALLEETSIRPLDTTVQQQAMLAIISMSRARLLLQKKKNSLLHLCFCSTFYLPAHTEPHDKLAVLYSQTLAVMDNMLQELVRTAGRHGLLELQDIFQLLLPYTISQPAVVQERAMARIVELTKLMTNYPLLEVCPCFLQATDLQHKCSKKYHFRLLGKLLAHLTLSCTCKHKGTCLEAAEALHHLHIFILQHLSKFPWLRGREQLRFQEGELEREPQQPSEIAYAEKNLMFMKFLQPSQQTDIMLMAIKNMRHPRAYPIDLVVRMVDVLLVDPAFQQEHVLNIMQAIHENLHFIMEEAAVNSLNCVLLALMHKHPSQTTVSLLECSPMCTCVATSMWKVIVSSPHDAEMVLLELIRILLNQSPRKTSITYNPRILSMAAATTISKILLQPNCLWKAESVFPQLFLALLFQVSFTNELTLQEVNIFWSTHQHGPVSPVRSAVWSMRTLLHHMGFESQVLAIEKKGGWDALVSTQTNLTGVRVLAREMMKMPKTLFSTIFCQLAELLHEEDSNWETVAMVFLVEMMSSPSLNEELDCVLDFFPIYMRSPCLGMRRLVLEGILKLLARPSTERKTLALLPIVMEQLQEDDSGTLTLALIVLGNTIHMLQVKARSLTALALAEKLQPLFDNESSTVRKLSIQVFEKAMECILVTGRREMKKEVWKSLLPLLFHTHDEDESVGKASQQALSRAGQFLKWSELVEVAETAETSKINECLLAKKGNDEQYLQQSQLYLQNPQEPLRLEAVRFIGFLGRQVNNKKLENIMELLQRAKKDKSPMVCCLATQMTNILKERKPKLSFSLPRLSLLLPKTVTRWFSASHHSP